MSWAFLQRFRSWPRTTLGAIESRLSLLNRLLAGELANRPGRLRSSMRMALITAVGAGMMAAAHVDSLLGINAIWATVAAPAAKMKPATGMTLIFASAAALAASVPLAGVLVEAPWLHLSFVAAAVAGSTYLLSDAQLADGWRQVQLFFVNTFWIVIFDPEGFGWSVGYNFGGALIAFGLIVLFDNVLWPDPSESELLRSLEASLRSIRERFILIGRGYLSPSGSVALPHPSTIGAMGNHLILLARAEREGIGRGRYAVLFSAVSSTERLRLEVERMLAIAREGVPRGIRQLVQPELQAALAAIDSGLQTGAADLAAGLTEERGSYDISRPVASALEAYSRRETELQAQFLISRADELSNLSAFVNSLHRIAELLIRNPSASGMASDVIGKDKIPRSRPDPVRMAYCLKLAAAAAAAFIVGLTAHRSDLTVILWTVVLAALPTFGASLRKMILRLVGAAIGGLIGLAAIIVISPNFETVLTYMLVCFIVLVTCAYVAAGGITIAYAGLQAGVTFLLLFVDLSPSIREYEALWRLWGIFLGLIIVGVVFLLMWPEYAGDSMTPRLRRILRIALDLTSKGQQDGSVQRVRDLEMEAGVTMTQLFAVADDARLEGRRSGIDPDRLVDAVGTLRRMVHRLGEIGESRFSAPHPPLSVEAQAADEALERALGNRFQSWLDEFERNGRLDSRRAIDVAASRKPDDLRGPLQHFEQRVSASNFAEIELWPDKARRALLARMESWRRLAVLADELDHQLANVPLPLPA